MTTRVRQLENVVCAAILCAIAMSCGTKREDTGNRASASSSPLGRGTSLVATSTSTTVYSTTTTTTTIVHRLPTLVPTEPFTTLAPAGAYEVLVLEPGEAIPKDLPPGHYRIRFPGQEDWPEQCLGEVISVGPAASEPSFDPAQPTGRIDEQARTANEEARREEYDRICGKFAVAEPLDPATVATAMNAPSSTTLPPVSPSAPEGS
jgi:hypothetical protein